jgi:hypothetical protein
VFEKPNAGGQGKQVQARGGPLQNPKAQRAAAEVAEEPGATILDARQFDRPSLRSRRIWIPQAKREEARQQKQHA